MQQSLAESIRLAQPEFWMAHPYQLWAKLREESPVYWSDFDRAWLVTSYAEIKYMSMNPQLFGNRYGFTSDLAIMKDDSEGFLNNGCPFRTAAELPGDMPRAAELRRDQSQAPFNTDHLVIADPPRHTMLRKVMGTAFTPRALGLLEESVVRLTTEMFDQFSKGDEVNFVEAIAGPVPMTLIAVMLGLPPSDHELFAEWSEALVEAANAPLVVEPEMLMRWGKAFMSFRSYFSEALEERHEHPRDDLLTAMLQVGPDGEPLLTLDDQIAMAQVLLGAGNETTRGLISGAAHSLWLQQDQRQILIDRPELLQNIAIEELLRFRSPVTQMCRTALEDTVLGGTPIAKGDYLVMNYESANRDTSVWQDADQLHVDRAPIPSHLAFGFAEHFCLGSNLARRTSRVVLSELLTRFPDYEVVGEVEQYRSVITPNLRVLPVVLQ